MLQATRRTMAHRQAMSDKATFTCRSLHMSRQRRCRLVGQSHLSMPPDHMDNPLYKDAILAILEATLEILVTLGIPDTEASPNMWIQDLLLQTPGMLTLARLPPPSPCLLFGNGSLLPARLSQGSHHRDIAASCSANLCSAYSTAQYDQYGRRKYRSHQWNGAETDAALPAVMSPSAQEDRRIPPPSRGPDYGREPPRERAPVASSRGDDGHRSSRRRVG